MERASVKMMKVRMAKPYAAYKKGEVVELPERQAESLIAWEYATRVTDADQPLLDATQGRGRKVERAQSEPKGEQRSA
jgi:hypothetical protein